MKILMGHNYYLERGGEDVSFESESALLKERGVGLATFIKTNDELRDLGWARRLRAGWRSIWSSKAYRELCRLLENERPSVAHFQNTFPQISAAAYAACRRFGIPVVQSLRNYRLMCSNGLFFRDGRPCEDCRMKVVGWPALAHACYRNSRIQTAGVVTMLAAHWAAGTWKKSVDVYVAPSRFARSRFVERGLSAERIVVKPNFVPDPGFVAVAEEGPILFVGRVTEDKGVEDLLRAVRMTRCRADVRVIGEGPDRPRLEGLVQEWGLTRVRFFGALPSARVMEEIRRASCVVVPSRMYETFGRVIMEAFACGVPVLASRLGALAELVTESVTGLGFEPHRPESLAAALDRMLSSPRERQEMGRRARIEYETRYTPELNFQMLLGIYRLALQRQSRPIPEFLRPIPAADPSRPPFDGT